MTKTEMLNNLIQRFGFEHQNPIHFAIMMQKKYSNRALKLAYELFMQDPIFDDEE